MRRWIRHRPPIGLVRFGSLRRVTPISRRWGYDRGLLIDRYYIEALAEEHRRDIWETVLEIKEPGYTYQFGSDVKHREVIDIDPDITLATIVSDLADAPQVPDVSFDCVIVTQTLQFVYDVRAAADTIHRILNLEASCWPRSRGSPPVDSEAEADHWRFTIG
jgi:Methyltransferase domain